MGGVNVSLASVKSVPMTLMQTGTIAMGVGVGLATAPITAVNFTDSYAIPTGVVSNNPAATPADMGIIILLLNATTVQAFRSQTAAVATAGFAVIGHR